MPSIWKNDDLRKNSTVSHKDFLDNVDKEIGGALSAEIFQGVPGGANISRAAGYVSTLQRRHPKRWTMFSERFTTRSLTCIHLKYERTQL